MKRSLVLCCVLVFVARGGAGQTAASSGKGILSLSLGPAIPVGDFASKNASSATSGLANIGVLADLSYQHRFPNSRVGWMASLQGHLNGVNKNATLTPFEAQYPGYQWAVNNNRWTTAAALLGLYYDAPLTPKLSLRGNIGMGIAESWSPSESITGIHDSAGFSAHNLILGTLHSAHAASFTGRIGLGVNYRLQGRWSLVANAQFAWLQPTFRNVTELVFYAQGLPVSGSPSLSTAPVVYAYETRRDYTQTMQTVDITLGVARTW